MSAKTDALRVELNNVAPENNLNSVLRIVNPIIDDIDVVTLDDLPTEDPLVDGQVWNNDGTPEVSAGA